MIDIPQILSDCSRRPQCATYEGNTLSPQTGSLILVIVIVCAHSVPQYRYYGISYEIYMYHRNLEREEKVYQLWRSGATIDEISLQARIPRSTVGYYVGKLKRSGRQRQVPEPVAPSDAGASTLESLIPKVFFIQNVGKLLVSGDFMGLYYFIQTYKMLMQMQSYLKFTKEEMELFQKAIDAPVSQTKETIASKPELTKKKTISEILESSAATLAERSDS